MTTREKQRNQLAQQFLCHFERESAQLSATHEFVKTVRKTLLGTNADRLHDAVERLDERPSRDEGLDRERERLLNQLCQVLELPRSQVSVSEFIRRLSPPLKEQLAESRRRLRQEARAMHQLNRANLAIAAQKHELIRCVLEGLTGQPTSSRYERSGRINHSDAGPIFEVKF